MLPGKKYAVSDYVAIGKRYWWIVALTTFVGTFAALIISASLRDSYQSEMLVQIVPQRVPDAFVQSTVTARTEDRMNSLEAQVKSRSQLERLIREFNLYPVELRTLPLEDVVNNMRAAISIEMIRPMRHLPADAFYVRFMYSDPDVASKVTSALGNVFIAQNARERGELAKAANKFLQTELGEAKARLAAQERTVERFRQANAGRLPTQSDFNMQAIQTVQTQMQALVESTARDRDRRLLLERLYTDAAAQPAPVPVTPTTGATAAADGGTATLPVQQQLQLARAQLTQMERRLTEAHPDVRRQRRVVSELERKLSEEPSGTSQPAAADAAASAAELQRRERLNAQKAEIESLDRQIAFKESEQTRLRATVADYQKRLEAIPGVESQWVALTRDYETLKTSYESLLKKSEDSKVAANLEDRQVGEQFRIVDPARVPVRPVGNVRVQTNAIGFFSGLVVGVGIVVLIFFRDKTFGSEADVLDVLSVRVLAVVPFVIDGAERRRRARRRMLVATGVGIVVASSAYVTWSMQLWKYVA